MDKQPDFEIFRKTLLCEQTDTVPLAELFHDKEVMDAFLGKEVNTTQDRIEFYMKAGFDYVPVDCGKWFGGVKSIEQEITETKKIREERKKRISFTLNIEQQFHICNLTDFFKYDWSHRTWLRGDGDLSYFDYIANLLPQGMKLIAWSDGIYEFFTKLVGYEKFCYALYDDPEFIEKIFSEVGKRVSTAFERVAAHPAVGALWLADDIGYTEGLLWPADLMRKYLFPHYKKIGDIAKKNNKPFIFHSDGKLWDILPDLIKAGVNAIQPIEPKAWNAQEIKQKYGKNLCIMGTIDLDLLCRGKREDVVAMVKNHIDLFKSGGGFTIGTSNTPTYYMNQENYKALLQTTLEYGYQSSAPASATALATTAVPI